MTTKALSTHERRIEFGDWQTPPALAREVLAAIAPSLAEISTVVEPTCGTGAFLHAAREVLPQVNLVGYDVNPAYVEAALAGLQDGQAQVKVANFFELNWARELEALAGPLLIIGNPPWVTNSALGVLNGQNLPVKANFQGFSGFDALTGKSNFDISEWMLRHLLESVGTARFFLAMLCKASVARRIMAWLAARHANVQGAVYAIDAKRHFSAAVDAVLLTLSNLEQRTSHAVETRWPVFGSLAATAAIRNMGVIDGQLLSDVDTYLATEDLHGKSEIEWRSGVKHDCARVMELRMQDGNWINGLGEAVDLEPTYLYPLLKGSDLANGNGAARRKILVTQQRIGDDTSNLRQLAPRTWAYLERHRAELAARKSSIYRGQPDFAMFGVGDYSFAPYKVAICGLYKKLSFLCVEPDEGRPVMLDDTAYFLPCASRTDAIALAAALNGKIAHAFFEARAFWDSKRPIHKAMLQSLSLAKLLQREGLAALDAMRSPAQATFTFQ